MTKNKPIESEPKYDKPIYDRLQRPEEEWERNQASRLRYYQKMQKRAIAAVQRAIARGDLAQLPSKGVYCVDCGVQAMAYDHRDYEKPLDVKAVCVSCNNTRGPAKNAPVFEPRAEEEREPHTADLVSIMRRDRFRRDD